MRSDSKAHDEINLVLLSGLLALTVYTYLKHDPFQDLLYRRSHIFEEAGKATEIENEHPIFFWLQDEIYLPFNWKIPVVYSFLTYAAISYIVFDLCYLLMYPECTIRLISLTLHHIFTLFLLISAVSLEFECITPISLIVEFNTILLTIKNIYRVSDIPSTSVFSCVVSSITTTLYTSLSFMIDILFVFSWILIRLIYFPYLLIVMHKLFNHTIFGYFYYIIVGSSAGLCALNYYWSVALVSKEFVVVMALAVFLSLSSL